MVPELGCHHGSEASVGNDPMWMKLGEVFLHPLLASDFLNGEIARFLQRSRRKELLDEAGPVFVLTQGARTKHIFWNARDGRWQDGLRSFPKKPFFTKTPELVLRCKLSCEIDEILVQKGVSCLDGRTHENAIPLSKQKVPRKHQFVFQVQRLMKWMDALHVVHRDIQICKGIVRLRGLDHGIGIEQESAARQWFVQVQETR